MQHRVTLIVEGEAEQVEGFVDYIESLPTDYEVKVLDSSTREVS